MRILIWLLLTSFSFQVLAVTVVTRIEDIEFPEKINEDILVFLLTGQVAKLPLGFLELVDELIEAEEKHSWLKITLNSQREIIGLEPADDPAPPESKMISIQSDYIPSVLKSVDWARTYFQESRRSPKDSQCFNRAHIWSYEWFRKHKFNSSKMFLFFTRKYIRENNFPWWFHVAPYIHVVIGNKVKERVMDIKYSSGPLATGDWVKLFIKDNPKCLTVTNYSDYANFPENGNCYLMRSSMYTYWPLDLENEELHGTVKTDWVQEEVKTAYLEAFDLNR